MAANCSGPLQQDATNKYGVPPSPRVIAEGEPVPKGGGRAILGKPYLVAGQIYTPSVDPNYSTVGTASWYGDAFHGRLTANGEVFDKDAFAAAHPTLPLPSYVRVTNLRNRRSIIVRVNDRGPYHGDRVIDVSQRVAEALDFKRFGTAHVKVDYLGQASLKGSDDRKLFATLRTDGRLAALPGGSLAPIMVASAETTRDDASSRRDAFSLVPLSRADQEVVRVARGTPLPPERPFDLGTIPNAGVPVASAVPPLGEQGRARGRAIVAASLF